MNGYVKHKRVERLPRIPRRGNLDITYRCENNCRHCWVRIPPGSPEAKKELAIDEIKKLLDEALAWGCRKLNISGGEPMLRPDFFDIFDYITRKPLHYTLNTNGTRITPEIARLLKRRGIKLVALYGADAKGHDFITRTPGSFAALMQGIAYLKEAGAHFTIQLVPMKDNYHQFKDMIKLAESLSPDWRIGASWLYLSAGGSAKKNGEIRSQRLSAAQVVELDGLDPCRDKTPVRAGEGSNIFAECIRNRDEFHVDPYGMMSFCSFVKEQSKRTDLRQFSFAYAWQDFIPSLSAQIQHNAGYRDNCGSCGLRSNCRWCPVFAYLEHKDYSARVDYLCSLAEEQKKYEDIWVKSKRRFYRIGGVTIQLDSDLPITHTTFQPKFNKFAVAGPGEDNITIRHHFSLPDSISRDLGKELYRFPPWAIYKKGDSWIYLCLSSAEHHSPYVQAAVFSPDYARNRLYNDDSKKELFLKGNLPSLSLMPSDQLLLSQVFAQREACYFHASGAIFEGSGLLFLGHSGAGKSTITSILQDEVEILCDDRMIVRKWPEGFKIHGTWSHGDIPAVSSNSAPLRALLFIQKADDNKLVRITDKRMIIAKLLSFLIKPLPTASWWEKMLALVGEIVRQAPCYYLYFNKSNDVKRILKEEFAPFHTPPAGMKSFTGEAQP